MMHGYIFPIVLQIVFFVVLVLEFILPSAGVLTAVSLVALVASWVLVLQSSISWLFSVVLVADVILIPVTLFVGFRLMQKSPMANHQELSHADGFLTQPDLPALWVGREALVHSQLKLGGKVELDGEIFEALSTGEYLDPGTRVRIISVSQHRLIVERVFEQSIIEQIPKETST